MDREQFREIDRLRERFVLKQRRGEGVSIEGTMQNYGGTYWRLMLTSLIAAEVFELRSSGQTPRVEDYCARFPGFAPYIRLAFGKPTIPHLFPKHWVREFL